MRGECLRVGFGVSFEIVTVGVSCEIVTVGVSCEIVTVECWEWFVGVTKLRLNAKAVTTHDRCERIKARWE
jgi:hypothetical protein